MIGFITIHYKDKRELEQFVLKNDKFKSLIIKQEIHSNSFIYPLVTSYQGMNFKVDEYKAYISGNIKSYYVLEKQYRYCDEFGYLNLCESIDLLAKETIQIEITTLSKLTIVFNLDSPICGSQLIKKNIIMHKLIGYNHNKTPNLKNELKLFEHHNYTLGIFSTFNKKSYSISIRLEYKTSAEFTKLGIKNIIDLKDKVKLTKLFTVFLKRFDELTIIDKIQDYDEFSKEDKKKLSIYMEPNFWDNLLKEDKRNSRYLAKKEFEKIQIKYKLNSLKNSLREQLIEEFNLFINN
jgi:hypothetical protein